MKIKAPFRFTVNEHCCLILWQLILRNYFIRANLQFCGGRGF